MEKIFLYCHFTIFLAGFTGTVYTLQSENKERIKNLELERNKLYQQINEAIDEGERALRASNDTDAEEGIQHLKLLKTQIQDIGGEASCLSRDPRNCTESSKSSGEIKFRNLSNNTESLRNLRRSRKKKDRGPDELDEIFIYKDFNKKKIDPQEAQLMLDNRLILDKKFKEWILKRKKERQLLKEYLEKKRINLLTSATERCPRFGFGKKKKNKKKSKSGRKEHNANFAGIKKEEDEVNVARALNANKRKYPCCRKCCKKSYLGCL